MRSAAALLLLLGGCVSAGQWDVPGVPGTSVDFVDIGNHPRAIVVRAGRVIYRGPDMHDTTFFEPAFFTGQGRTLMLANYGSEDSWGIAALSFEGAQVRDLGTIDVATPADEVSGYTGSALEQATVRDENGAWVITLRGPLVSNPGGEHQRPIDGDVIYREVDGQWERRGGL